MNIYSLQLMFTLANHFTGCFHLVSIGDEQADRKCAILGRTRSFITNGDYTRLSDFLFV